MVASFAITVNIPTCDTRRAEVAHGARSARFAAFDLQAKGGQQTSGNLVMDGGIVIGSWTYTPQAPS
jgi:hypothetical protein